jgi:hypothetical protein
LEFKSCNVSQGINIEQIFSMGIINLIPILFNTFTKTALSDIRYFLSGYNRILTIENGKLTKSKN